ncbi:MAG: heme utilization cystosolic carrier protein HutX [Pseudomonadota bacterium]
MVTSTDISLGDRLKTFDGFLERLAREEGMSTFALVGHLPESGCQVVPGARMQEILHDVADWGAVLFITEGNGVITGTSAVLPKIFLHDGYYHFFGESGFGGHIAEHGVQNIAFIDRPFQGRRSLSIHFYDPVGEPMFKVFLSRELNGDMKADQIDRYFALKARLMDEV